MTSDMSFECLLVSRDPAVVCTVERILRDLSISIKICPTHSSALAQLRTSCPDLFVIDWDTGSISDLVHDIWKANARPKPTLVAVATEHRVIPGVHVLLSKPVTAQNGTRSLKQAYSRMMLDHRRHVRYAVMETVEVNTEHSDTFAATVTDIGEGGVGLSTKRPLEVGNLLSFSLPLAEARKSIFLQVKVLWARNYGGVGCEFVRIPPVDKDVLRDWLIGKIRVKKPSLEVR